jgi:hypothetical protein
MAQPLSEATVITILSTSGRPTLITGSSIQMPVQIQSSIATVPVNVVGGSITVGTVSVVVDVATVSDILTGTIATVQSVGGTVSVDVVGGTASVNVLGTPPVSITGTPSVTVQGIATVSQQAVSYSYQQTGLATIKATAGALYEAILTGEAGLTAAAGTVVLLNGTGTIAVLAVPSGDMRQARFGPGVSFGTLIASIIGTVDLTVVYR